MTQKFSNAARAELASTINSSDTAFAITSGGALFPIADTGASAIGAGADWFKLVLQDTSGIEIVYVRTHTDASDTFSNVIRGQEGTTAREFLAASIVGLRPTAGDAEETIYEGDARLTDSRVPSGGAGGVLSGSYPNPGFAVDMATQAELDAVATAKQDAVTAVGVLKGSGSAVSAATAGTDYVAPDTATNFTKPQRPSLQTETAPSSNAITWDLTDDTVYQLNLNANVTTFNLTGTLAALLGYQYQLIVRYNGGTTITWNSNFKWPGGTAPTLTGTSGKIDIFNFTVCSTDGGTTAYLLNTGKSQNMGA